MQYIVYLLIALAATTIGACTGMGGGVIIKPVLDMMGNYDVHSISMLSSITVLFMAMVSVGRYIAGKQKIHSKNAVILALGSILGSYFGGSAIKTLSVYASNNIIVVVQNIVLALLLVCTLLYTIKKEAIKTLGYKKTAAFALVGVVLGFFSSFLGIGGGPINVILIAFVFSYSLKEASVYSLVIILFAQILRVGQAAVLGGFGRYNLEMLVPMVVGAVAGGLIGSQIHKKMSDKNAAVFFNAAQIGILVLCVCNIARYTYKF